MYILKIRQDTVFKTKAADLKTLLTSDWIQVKAGQDYPASSQTLTNGHLKFSLGKDRDGKQIEFKGRNTWYVWAEAVELLKNGLPVSPIAPKSEGNPLTKYLPKKIVKGDYLLMYPQGRIDQFGGDLYSLALIRKAQFIDQVMVISGVPGAKPVERNQDWSGSMKPLFEGIFPLGEVEEGNWGNAIGFYWIEVFDTAPRQAVGIHEDANRGWSPGSAGCISPLNETDTIKVMNWRKGGAKTLVVNYGWGLV